MIRFVRNGVCLLVACAPIAALACPALVLSVVASPIPSDDHAAQDRESLGQPATIRAAGSSGEGRVDYTVADEQLRVERIDRVPGESLLSIRVDPEGRLFVGGREALFVYEPDDHGGYHPRKLLYRFPEHTWLNDIAIRGDDLYVMTNAALYRFPGGRTRRVGLVPERLVWGWPVDLHVTLHGLAWGPEGLLYVSAGDPLLNYGDFQNRPDHWSHWTIMTASGDRVPYTGQGGIFRFTPDGGFHSVYAGGLRGPFGLTFDRRWELYTNDNDHESLPASYSPARLLHVVEGADFAWPRGWMAGKSPDRADLLETMAEGPGLGREVPVGMTYHDDSLLPERYRDCLLLARWGQRRIDAFRLVPRGASYTVEERPLLIGEGTARPVGVAVGRGGRVFGVISYMQNNEWSPAYVADLILITTKDDSENHPFEPIDWTEADDDRLLAELASPSWSRRSEAHQEWLRRRYESPDNLRLVVRRLQAEVNQLAGRPGPTPAGDHLGWIASVIGDSSNLDPDLPRPSRLLLDRSTAAEGESRRHALRALIRMDLLSTSPVRTRDVLIRAIEDPDPRIALEAILKAGNAPQTDAGPLIEAILGGPARSRDTYIRQAVAHYLASVARPDELAAICADTDPALRLVGVLAVGRRLTVPPPGRALDPQVPLRYEAGNAAFEVQYADARIDLRTIGPIGSFTIAEAWAHGRRTTEDRRNVQILRDRAATDADDLVRLQAAYYLDLLDDPESRPLVATARREVESRRLGSTAPRAVERVWLVGPFPVGDAGRSEAPDRLTAGPVDLDARYSVGGDVRSWEVVEAGDGVHLAVAPDQDGPSISFAYFRLQSYGNEPATLDVSGVEAVEVRLNGRAIPGGAGPFRLDLQPGSNDVLMRVEASADGARLRIAVRAPERVVVALPERLGLATLAERLKAGEAGGEVIAPEFLDVDWAAEVGRGDPERGRQLFGPDGLGCAKCHAITDRVAVAGGPSLAGARQRFTIAHVIESVLLPGKQVAPIFRATSIATVDGQVLTGLVVNEGDDAVELLLPDTSRRSVPRATIEERRLQEASPMPASLVRTPDELRDLLAYILGEDPKEP